MKETSMLVILPRGEAIRNFLYSGMISSLSEQTAVHVAGVDPGADISALLKEAVDSFHPVWAVDEHLLVRLTRSLLDQAHGRHIWSEAAQERYRRRDMEAESPLDRARRLVWRVLARSFSSNRGIEAASRLERLASQRFPPLGEAQDLIASLSPDLVFNGSHIHSALAVPLVQAARWADVPTSTFLFSWDNLTSQGRILDIYDHFLAWNESIAADLLSMYPSINANMVTVTGTPQFDFHFHDENRWSRERWASEVGVDPDRPVVLYTTGMPNHMPGEPELVELLADQLAEMGGHGSPQLLVRVYAKDQSGRFDELRGRRTDITFAPVLWLPDWLTPLPGDAPLWTSTLQHVACGVNVASTVSLELCMFDKPVINIAFNPRSVPRSFIDYERYYRFDHYAPVVASGAVSVAYDAGQLSRMVHEAIACPGRNQGERSAILVKMFGETLDGKSAIRVADALRSRVAG